MTTPAPIDAGPPPADLVEEISTAMDVVDPDEVDGSRAGAGGGGGGVGAGSAVDAGPPPAGLVDEVEDGPGDPDTTDEAPQ